MVHPVVISALFAGFFPVLLFNHRILPWFGSFTLRFFHKCFFLFEYLNRLSLLLVVVMSSTCISSLGKAPLFLLLVLFRLFLLLMIAPFALTICVLILLRVLFRKALLLFFQILLCLQVALPGILEHHCLTKAHQTLQLVDCGTIASNCDDTASTTTPIAILLALGHSVLQRRPFRQRLKHNIDPAVIARRVRCIRCFLRRPCRLLPMVVFLVRRW